jgi:hypothetical protein
MIVEVKEDAHGELYIELPPELIESLGWNEESTVLWTIDDDGKVRLGLMKDDSSNEA